MLGTGPLRGQSSILYLHLWEAERLWRTLAQSLRRLLICGMTEQQTDVALHRPLAEWIEKKKKSLPAA